MTSLAAVASRTELLDRDEELGQIEAVLAEAALGRGRLTVVEGPAGIGKTALLAAARTAASASGMRVLRSRAHELEREFPFGVVRQLFEPLLAEATEEERAFLLQGAAGVAASMLALPGAPAPASPSPTDADPVFAILHGLYWLCVNAAVDGPLCLFVDDAQCADGPSLRYLAVLLKTRLRRAERRTRRSHATVRRRQRRRAALDLDDGSRRRGDPPWSR